MLTTIIILIVIASIFLVLVILSQNSKGGGMTGLVGNSGASQILGARKTGDFLERSTWVLLSVIIVGSLLSTTLIERNGTENEDSILDKASQSAPAQSQDLLDSDIMKDNDSETETEIEAIDNTEEAINDTIKVE